MPRKTKEVTIEGSTVDNRDAGKTYVITEMAAIPTEKWGMRAYLAMARSGVEIPEEISAMGVPGLFLVGLRAISQAKWSDAEPLLDEMMSCVKLATAAGVSRAATLEGDIEEWSTLVRLRQEVIELHLGFTIAEGLSRLHRSSTTSAVHQTP